MLYAVEPHLPHITRMIPHSSNIPMYKKGYSVNVSKK
nr:MAG TPA: hypothetical protein [Caudoviricetes sp.]